MPESIGSIMEKYYSKQPCDISETSRTESLADDIGDKKIIPFTRVAETGKISTAAAGVMTRFRLQPSWRELHRLPPLECLRQGRHHSLGSPGHGIIPQSPIFPIMSQGGCSARRFRVLVCI